MPRHPPRLAEQADERAARAFCRPLGKGGPADEVARLVQSHHAPKPCLIGGDVGTELVAVQRHAGLKPQRIAGREPGRREAARPTVAVSASQIGSQSAGAQKISKPSSPVYPVRATHASRPATVP